MPKRSPYPISDHSDGFRFFNPGFHGNRTWWDVWKWRRTSQATPWSDSVPFTSGTIPDAPRDDTIMATWINHATVLLQTRHGNLITDPVFGERTSPVSWMGPKRVHPPGIAWTDLPQIHVILLSHDHYDHCDGFTLRQFARGPHPPIVVAPLGHHRLLRRFGFPAERIIELDWWEAHEFKTGFHVRATPARHWSNRFSGKRNGRLWSGFFVQAGGRTFYHVGDTAWDDEFFNQVQARCGSPDLALIPIGAYEPRWFMKTQHCNPEEAVKIHRAIQAGRSLGIHWGTFQLTDEDRTDPLIKLTLAKEKFGVNPDEFVTLDLGGSVAV